MIKDANNILFRCSGLHYLMVEPKEKSPLQRYTDAVATLNKARLDYEGMNNKTTKTATKKLQSIERLEVEVKELEASKDDLHIAEGTKTHLVDVFVSERYGRKEEATGKMLEKGNEREEDSITLLSLVTKKFYIKNEVSLNNEFIKGTPDLSDANEIVRAKHTVDTKTSWSAHTFFRAQKSEKINPAYYWQGQGYMALTGATQHTIAYCLVNSTRRIIDDEKRKAAWEYGVLDPSAKNNPAFIKKCKQIEINHIFDLKAFIEENPGYDFDNDTDNWQWDIPKEERLYLVTFERNDEDIERLFKRIAECREWMNKNLFKQIAELVSA